MKVKKSFGTYTWRPCYLRFIVFDKRRSSLRNHCSFSLWVQALSNLGKVLSSQFGFRRCPIQVKYCHHSLGLGAVQFRQSIVFIVWVQALSNLCKVLSISSKSFCSNLHFPGLSYSFNCFYFLNIKGNFVVILPPFKPLRILRGVGFLHLPS